MISIEPIQSDGGEDTQSPAPPAQLSAFLSAIVAPAPILHRAGQDSFYSMTPFLPLAVAEGTTDPIFIAGPVSEVIVPASYKRVVV
jgi:hypothetical protein